MGKPDLEELQYLFLKNLCEYAPNIITDLFRRKDPIAWTKHWGLESDWIIENAGYALEMRIGNTFLQAWLKAIQGIRYEFKPPPLEIELFAEDETFHYLQERNLIGASKRVHATIRPYALQSVRHEARG